MSLGLFAPNSFSQTWEKVAKFSPYYPTYIYTDTTNNSLFYTGRFLHVNDSDFVGITSYQNNQYLGLSCGINWNCISPLSPNGAVFGYGVVSYNNQIYLTGSFGRIGNIPTNNFGVWDGQDWSSGGIGIPDGYGAVFSIIDNQLYLAGTFDSAFGMSAHSLIKFDGQTWSDVYNIPKFSPVGNENYFNKVVKYKNKLYVSGQFYSGFGANDINAITVYNDSNWVKVGTGIPNPNDAISDMVIYKNELIVGGHFTKQTNALNPGNNIAAWDGTNWHSLGDASQGFGVNGINASVVRMIVHGDYLYVCGHFSEAGNQTATNIARWDGTNWCALATGFASATTNESVTSIALYGDTLFAVGDFTNYAGDTTIRYAAKLSNPDSWVTNCTTVGVNEYENLSNKITAFPNPTNNKIYFKGLIKNTQIDIYNNLGQLQLTYTDPDNNGIDISNLATGFYMYTIADKQHNITTAGKFVKKAPYEP